MTWRAYRLTFRLLSPLHVGYYKLGNLQRTRHYVPGRNFWAAATARLTRLLSGHDYEAVGGFVRRHMAFGYFFPAVTEDAPLYPSYDAGGVSYGPPETTLPAEHFEHLLLSSYAATALDDDRRAATEGSLHEVECLLSLATSGAPVFLIGHVFAREDPQFPPSVVTPATYRFVARTADHKEPRLEALSLIHI